MERRTALKIVALTGFSTALTGGGEAAVLWSPDSYKLRFFDETENELMDELMEMIIPADAHSPGAQAAKVSLFADWMVFTGDEGMKTRWRQGLRLFRDEAAGSSPARALAKAAANEHHPVAGLERFFVELKRMTVSGYYTSAIGIHQDLQYVGNTYLAAFPGCTNQG
ncbi:MAG: gluconate 2-dehydrogenase subunit 3 family protein [Terriglobia bacterium]